MHFSFNAPDRLLTACHLAAAHYREGGRLAVYCSDKRRLHAYNRLLWEYERGAFVPHLPAADPLAERTPIVLYDSPPPAEARIVLNLDDACVPEAQAYERILEVVGGGDAERERARRRWRDYQQAGHTIHRQDIANAE
nr:DNA polymerase III subunit chi [Verticiella sediminum]